MLSRWVRKSAPPARRNVRPGAGSILPITGSLALLWALILLVLLGVNVQDERRHTLDMARQQALSFFQRILMTRAWDSEHGGTYVLAAGKTPAGSNLDGSLRDLATREGARPTETYPDVMIQQIADLAPEQQEIKFHITV